jgi:hypothetical protein
MSSKSNTVDFAQFRAVLFVTGGKRFLRVEPLPGKTDMPHYSVSGFWTQAARHFEVRPVKAEPLDVSQAGAVAEVTLLSSAAIEARRQATETRGGADATAAWLVSPENDRRHLEDDLEEALWWRTRAAEREAQAGIAALPFEGEDEGQAPRPAYCVQPAPSCRECSLTNYGLDCMNNPIAE